MSSPRSIRSVDDDGEGMDLGDMFGEQARPATPPPTFASYTRPAELPAADWQELSIRLVGEHPLWGQHLWNAARVFATYLLENADTCLKGKKVLELGAAGALPGIISALSGAATTVITDYPDQVLIDNMQFNVDLNVPESQRADVHVMGHCWGKNVQPMLDCLPLPDERFDTVILSDLVFNHSQHAALLDTCNATTHERSELLVFYTHHRPHLAEADVAFFDMARERGWESETIKEEWTGPMFEHDRGDEKVRGTVWGWRCWRTTTPPAADI